MRLLSAGAVAEFHQERWELPLPHPDENSLPTLQTEKVITSVAEADTEDVNRAVKAARKAFDEGPWPRTPGAGRGRVLSKCADRHAG